MESSKMNVVHLIGKKRDGAALSTAEIDWLVAAYTAGDIADYQIAALLMAIVWRGMDARETVDLTLAMVRSGAELRVRDGLSPVVDKHSTGGLAKTMVSIGEDAGVRTLAVLSAMRQPLGHAVGNALELAEALAILRGEGPEDVTALCHHEAVTLLTLADVAANGKEAEARVARAISSGSALAKLAEVVAAQGGDASQVEDPTRLPAAPARQILKAPHTAYVAGIDAERVGLASVRLGAGRARKEDAIDHAVGLVLLAKVGDRVAAGQPLIEVHARTEAAAKEVSAELLASYTWSNAANAPPALILGTVERPGSQARRPRIAARAAQG